MTHEQRARVVWYFLFPESIFSGAVCVPAQIFAEDINFLAEATKNKGIADFKRDYCINSVSYKNNHGDIDTALDTLIRSAHAYETKEPASTSDNYNLLNKWIRSRGGQDNNFIFQDLVRANYFTSNHYNAIGISSAKQLYANWRVNDGGKLQLEIAQDIYAIDIKDKNDTLFVIVKVKGKIKLLNKYNPDDMEELKRLQEAKSLEPIMRMASHIELTIQNGVVIPLVRNLEVASFSRYLLRPPKKMLMNQLDVKSAALLRYITYVDAVLLRYKNQKTICENLHAIGQILELCDYGKNPEYMKFALQYIEKIYVPVTRLFKTEHHPMLSVLAKDANFCDAVIDITGTDPKIPKKDADDEDFYQFLEKFEIDTPTPISSSDKDNDMLEKLGTLYVNFKRYAHTCQPVERYAFNTVIAEENPALTDWAQQFNPENETYRNNSIKQFPSMHQVQYSRLPGGISDEHEVISTIATLIKHSKYGQIESTKNDLLEWFVKHGSKYSGSISAYLLENNMLDVAFPGDIKQRFEHMNIQVGQSTPLQSNWHLNPNGEIVLDFSINIMSLNCFSKEHDELDIIAFKQLNKEQIQLIDRRKDYTHESPLMNVTTQVKLTIDSKGKVKPVMSKLNIETYTSGITVSKKYEHLLRNKPDNEPDNEPDNRRKFNQSV